MPTAAIVVIIVVIVVIISATQLVRAKRSLRLASRRLDKDWSDIEALVKQRNDNLPRLIQTCRSYMPAQQQSLVQLAGARRAQQSAQSAPDRAAVAEQTNRALEALLRDAEGVEGLKRNSTFIQLQNALSEIDERISERREAFNSDAERYNARLGRFPGKLYAGKKGLKPRAPWRNSE